MVTDVNGNSYVIGGFANSISFGPTTLTGGPDGNTFIAKYDSNGNMIWANAITGTSVVESADIAVDASGNPYITGNFKGTVTLGKFTLTSSEDRSAFVTKFDQSGKVVWAKKAGSADGDVRGTNIAVDVNGSAYVTGNFFKTATFGGVIITATKNEQLFISKYTSEGDISWVKMAGGLGSCFTHDITTDQSGSLYLTGQFWMTAAFGTTTLTNHSDVTRPADIFVARYDANGNALWAKQAGGPEGSDVGTGIAVDETGNSYISGFFQNRATFGSAAVSGNATGNIFLAKYSAAGILQWIKKQESSGDARSASIGRDINGNLYIAGHFEGSVSFGNTALVSAGAYDMFFIKYSPTADVLGATQAGGAGLDLVKKLSISGNGTIYFTGDFSGPAVFGSSTLEQGIVVGKLSSMTMPKPVPSITTGDLKTAVLCAGAAMEVPFSTNGVFGTDNIFSVQLSNSYGSFSNPTVIGSGAASPIAATIPAWLATGPGYKIRVVASSPKVNGTSNEKSLTMNKPPVVIASAAARAIQEGSSTNLYASGADVYIWSPAKGLSDPNIADPVASPQATTTYTVTGIKNGCSSTSTVTVRVEPVPVAGSAFEWSWVKNETNTGYSSADISVIDSKGNVYATGQFSESLKLGSVTLTINDGSKQIFLAKYNAEGQVLWAKQLPGYVVDMAVDAQDNLYLMGSFLGTMTLGDYKLTASTGSNYFAVKYSESGNVIWATQTNGSHYNVAAIAASPTGELYITGTFSGSTSFSDVTLSSGTNSAFFVVKYDVHGKVIWGNTIKGSSDKNYEIGMATDVEGAVYITSSISVGTLEFSSLLLTNSKGGPNTFVSKYQPNGQLHWAKLINQNQEDYSETRSSLIAVDKNKNVYLVGRFNNYTRFEAGPELTASIAGTNGFFAKYDTEGNFKWVTETGGIFAFATGLTIDPKDNIYITGVFSYTAIFGTRQLVIGNAKYGNTDYGIYVTRYDVNGNAVWAEKATTSPLYDIVSRGISVDSRQNIYLVGSFNRTGTHQTVNFGCHTIKNSVSASEQYYVAKLSALSGELPVIVTGNVSGAAICPGSTIEIPFSITGNNSGCTSYMALLSDEKGSFVESKIIGTGTGEGNKIVATIPANIYGGNGYRIKIISSAPAITGTDNGTNISLSVEPAPSIIASVSNPCPGTTGVTYTAQSAYQATSYTWVVPEGWIITEGQGTNKVKVRVGASAGEVTVTIPGACGQEIKRSLAVAPANVFAPTVRDLSKKTCGTGNTVFVASGAPYGATYRWYASATSPDPIWEDRSSESESRFYTPVVSITTNFYVSIRFSNGCEGERIKLTLNVNSKPDMPNGISASVAKPCAGAQVIYEVPAVSNAAGYEWNVPFGWVILEGQDSPRIRVKAGAEAGVITVTAYNHCGYSERQSLSIETGVPVGPTVLSGLKCGASSVNFYATGAPEGGTYKWYASTSAIEPLALGQVFTTPLLTQSTLYYATVVSAEGCESARIAVTAIIKPAAVATAGINETVCSTIPTYTLTGFSPDSGTWTGTAVTAKGIFHPNTAGVGIHKLTYTFIDENGCVAVSTKDVIVSTCTGIKEIETPKKISIFPNPTSEALHIVLPLSGKTNLAIRLINAKGQTVYSQVFGEVAGEIRQTINVKDKPQGVYLLQFTMDKEVIAKQVLIN